MCNVLWRLSLSKIGVSLSGWIRLVLRKSKRCNGTSDGEIGLDWELTGTIRQAKKVLSSINNVRLLDDSWHSKESGSLTGSVVVGIPFIVKLLCITITQKRFWYWQIICIVLGVSIVLIPFQDRLLLGRQDVYCQLRYLQTFRTILVKSGG